MEFLSSDRSTFSRQARLASQKKKGSEGLFVWVAVIAILTAMTAFSWIFCMYVFGHPEKAFSYNLLTKMEKLSPLRDYQPANAPYGKFYTPREIHKLYYGHNKQGLRALSSILRREYITNYRGVMQVIYIRGAYIISSVRPLNDEDLFTSGLVIRGRAEDYPNVEIEYILPAAHVPERHYDPSGKRRLQIATSSTCAAVINVARVSEDHICVTAVPITYGTHQTAENTKINLRPPAKLNLHGKLPISGASDTPAASSKHS